MKRVAIHNWFVMSLALAAVLFIGMPGVHAQTAGPSVVITWHTSGSYIPPSYSGKALPTLGTQITASVMIVAGGSVSNLSSQTIYWYLNDTLLGGGIGVQTVTFSPFGMPQQIETLKVDIPDYPGGELIADTDIPLVSPVAVIDAPTANGIFSENPLTLEALPYFFNVDSLNALSFFWSVNGQTGSSTGNPAVAEIMLPAKTAAGSQFDVTMGAAGPGGGISASDEKFLTYQPLP